MTRIFNCIWQIKDHKLETYNQIYNSIVVFLFDIPSIKEELDFCLFPFFFFFKV